MGERSFSRGSGCVFTLSTHTSYSIVFSKKNPAREKSKRNLPQRVCLTIKFHRHARGQLCCSCTRSSVCAPHTYVCRFVLCPHACAAPCSTRTLVQIYVPSLHSYCLFTRTHIHTHTHIYIYIIHCESSRLVIRMILLDARVLPELALQPCLKNQRSLECFFRACEDWNCLRWRANPFPMPSFIARGYSAFSPFWCGC